MNKKAQNLMFAIIMAVMLFACGMLFVGHVRDEVISTRAIGLDCTNTNISDGNKLACLGVDTVVPILIVTVVSVAGGVILSRFLL